MLCSIREAQLLVAIDNAAAALLGGRLLKIAQPYRDDQPITFDDILGAAKADSFAFALLAGSIDPHLAIVPVAIRATGDAIGITRNGLDLLMGDADEDEADIITQAKEAAKTQAATAKESRKDEWREFSRLDPLAQDKRLAELKATDPRPCPFPCRQARHRAAQRQRARLEVPPQRPPRIHRPPDPRRAATGCTRRARGSFPVHRHSPEMSPNVIENLKCLKAASIALAAEMPGDGIEIEISRMRIFLARVVRTPLAAIKVTGNPATDENTDLLGTYQVDEPEGPGSVTVTKGTLCRIQAIELDSLLAKMQEIGEASHHLIGQAREAFARFTAGRPVLYR